MDNKEQKWVIPEDAIRNKVTEEAVTFAESFGKHLASKIYGFNPISQRNEYLDKTQLSSSQLRRFFGEVKRQQMTGYNETRFLLLKPKLAYAVGRAKSESKFGNRIEDLYNALAAAIDIVVEEERNIEKKKQEEKGKKEWPSPFRNFIAIFEAIVAYHKVAEK